VLSTQVLANRSNDAPAVENRAEGSARTSAFLVHQITAKVPERWSCDSGVQPGGHLFGRGRSPELLGSVPA
jgi:hypothetical protein